MMILDITTLLAMSVALGLLYGALAHLLAYRHPEARDIRAWGSGSLLAAAALLLIALRGQIPPWISIDLANVLLYGGYLAWLHGIRLFAGKRTPTPVFAVVFIAGMAVILWFHHVDPSLKMRTGTSSLLHAWVVALCAVALRDSHKDRGSAAWCFSLAWLVLFSLFHAARAVVVFMGAYEGDRLLPVHPMDSLLLMGIVIANIAMLSGLTWMHLERAQAALRHQAIHDPLTGLLNRGEFIARFEREASRAARGGATYSLLMVDIDHFKRVNDAYGHPAGDQVLREIAARLTALLRPHDSIGRYGGEEFAVLVPDSGPEAARQVAERMRAAVQGTRFHLGGDTVEITISIGVASSSDRHAGWEALLAAADRALYEAKAAGRNRVILA